VIAITGYVIITPGLSRTGRIRDRNGMSEASLVNRILSAANEPLRPFGPLGGLFHGFDADKPPSFQESVDEFVAAVRDGLIPLVQSSGPERLEYVLDQIKMGASIAIAAARDMKLFTHKETPLCESQLAAIHMYSQETDMDKGKDSLYAILNNVLRSSNRILAKSIRKIIWLLLTALRLCPKSQRKNLYRGVKASIAGDYQKDRIITWYQISSCTGTIEALENPMFLGTKGERTLFGMELMDETRARQIASYSAVGNEDEAVFPPNTCFEVRFLPHTRFRVHFTDDEGCELSIVNDEGTRRCFRSWRWATA
jgi:hypothetical protein